MNRTYLATRIEAIKKLIDSYTTCIDSLVFGQVQSYTLDTGQSRQTVTRYDLDKLQTHLDSLLNQLSVLEARYYQSGTIIGRPAW